MKVRVVLMMIVERDGGKYVDDTTLREMLDMWDDNDVICGGFASVNIMCPSDDGFVAVTNDGRLLSEDDVYDIADAKLREDYPDPVEIAHLEFDVAYALAKFAPDAYEEYVSEEVDRLVENDTLRCLQNWRGPSLARL